MIQHKSIKDFIKSHLKSYFTLNPGEASKFGLYKIVIEEVEKALISEAMRETNNIQAQAAKILGISRNTLKKKLEDLKID